MTIFKPVILNYDGKEYKIEATVLMPLLAQMEDVISLDELTNRKRPPMVKVSMAYGLALRYAGAEVSDEEIYQSVFTKAGASVIAGAVSGLLAMMIPPSELQNAISSSKKIEKKPGGRRKN